MVILATRPFTQSWPPSEREREREIAKWLFLQLDPLLSLGLPERERERGIYFRSDLKKKLLN